MQIGIIGAGKVGCSVGKYLQENDALRKAGYHITGYAGKKRKRGRSCDFYRDNTLLSAVRTS